MVTGNRAVRLAAVVLFLASCFGGPGAWAIAPQPPKGPLHDKVFFRPELVISSSHVPVDEALPQLDNRAQWQSFSADRTGGAQPAAEGFVDARSGAATNVMGSFPLIPGDGVGNRPSGSAGARATAGTVTPATVTRAVLDFVQRHRACWRSTPQLGTGRAVQVNPDLWQVSIPQV